MTTDKKTACLAAWLVLAAALPLGAGGLTGRVGAQLPDADDPPVVLSVLEPDLIGTQKAFLDAFQRGDVSYIKNAVAEDFLAISASGKTSGKVELLGTVRATGEAKPASYDFNVAPLSDSAAVVSYDVFPEIATGRYHRLRFTWVKRDGQWKLKFLQTVLKLWNPTDL